MKRAAEHVGALSSEIRLRTVYADLDGTLLGPGGSLFAAGGGGVSGQAAEALLALHQAEISVVPVSGRTAEQVRETARLVGARDFVAELGGIVSLDLGEEVIRDTGAYEGPATPVEAMARSGAAATLLEAHSGRLEPHAPWAFAGREATMLFRGLLDVSEANAFLADAGYEWLKLQDNGVIPRRYASLDADEVHAYHLAPRGVDKPSGVAAHMVRRGLPREGCVAVGDAPSDVGLAAHVAAVFVVANGRAAVEASGPLPGNVYATEGSYGEGFAEVVAGLLAPGALPRRAP